MRSRVYGALVPLSSAVAALLLCAGAVWAAPKAYVGNFEDDSVSVVDTTAAAVLATVPVAAGPHGIVISRDGRWVYVAGDKSSTVSVIDARTDRVVHAIEVGRSPHGLALSPDGATLLVAVNGEDRVTFVDTASRSVVATAPVPKPHTIAIQPDGRLAYAASQEPGHFGLAVLDLARRAVVRTLPLVQPPRDVEFAGDGRALYVTLAGVNAVQVLSPGSEKIEATIPTGVSPHVAKDPAGSPFGMVVVQGDDALLLFDPSGNRPVRSIGVGKQPHWVASSSDGRTAYVTNEGSDTLTIVTLADGKTRSIRVGHGPRKVAVQPEPSPARVSIKDFQFQPATVTIRVGQSVRWSNDDGAPHAVHLEAKSGGADRPLQPGEAFTRVFLHAGTFAYGCSFHNYMRGRVVVLEG